MSNQMEVIKKGLLNGTTISFFRDSMPNATGKHAEEAAKRFAKMAYTTICQNPTLQRCSLPSIIKAASISASLDLDIDTRGLAYLVPYKNKRGQLEAQFQIGYLGLIELAYRSGKVKAISAHCVYESEKDQVKIIRFDGQYKVEHPFAYERPTGKMVAVYATAQVEGMGPSTVVLRADEVEHYRKLSKAPDSPAWKNHYEAMAKKTAIRQLAKFLPKSILEDFSRGAAADEQESFVEAQQSARAQIEAEAGSETFDATFQDEGEADPEWQAKKDAAKAKLQEAEAEGGAQEQEEEPEFMRED